MDSKVCKGCGRQLPLSDFYVHKGMADGHKNFCKDCYKKKTTNYIERNKSKVRERLADYYLRNKERIRERDKDRRRVPNREGYSLEYKQNYPERYKAGYIARNAVKSGVLVKPTSCSVCGCTDRPIEAHHWDYQKPLEVQWVCRSCHRMLDKQRRMEENINDGSS